MWPCCTWFWRRREVHLVHAARYVSLNPVRARLVARAADWPWSSVRAHLAQEDDALVRVAPLIERVGAFGPFPGDDEGGQDEAIWRTLRRAETTGRPVGSDDWLAAIEARTGRTLRQQKRGPKPKQKSVFCKVEP